MVLRMMIVITVLLNHRKTRISVLSDAVFIVWPFKLNSGSYFLLIQLVG